MTLLEKGGDFKGAQGEEPSLLKLLIIVRAESLYNF